MATSHPLTPVSRHDLRALLGAQKKAYYRQGIANLAQRLERLDTLFNLLKTNQLAIAEAISRDFGHRAHQATQLAQLFLGISPLIGVLAAGNRCMIKMATHSNHLSHH